MEESEDAPSSSSLKKIVKLKHTKGQLNSEWIYDVIVSPEIPTKNFKNYCLLSLLEGRVEIH